MFNSICDWISFEPWAVSVMALPCLFFSEYYFVISKRIYILDCEDVDSEMHRSCRISELRCIGNLIWAGMGDDEDYPHRMYNTAVQSVTDWKTANENDRTQDINTYGLRPWTCTKPVRWLPQNRNQPEYVCGHPGGRCWWQRTTGFPGSLCRTNTTLTDKDPMACRTIHSSEI